MRSCGLVDWRETAWYSMLDECRFTDGAFSQALHRPQNHCLKGRKGRKYGQRLMPRMGGYFLLYHKVGGYFLLYYKVMECAESLGPKIKKDPGPCTFTDH